MLKKIYGAALIGTKGVLVRCEADVEQGFPTITFIGSLAASVREAADRVRTALGNSGFHLEPRRVTLNLSPAELRKEGCAYDLPIAVSLLAAYGELPENLLTDTLFAGELSLSGEILPVRGVLSMVRCAAAAGLKRCFLPGRQCHRRNRLLRCVDTRRARGLAPGTNALARTGCFFGRKPSPRRDA